MKELKEYIKILMQKNKELILINNQKTKIINDLTNQIEMLKGDLEDDNINGGIKKLVYKKHNLLGKNREIGGANV